MALFEARHLHMRFGDRVVLEDISLDVDHGEVLGIMGPNGAGKTTCFNVLTGRYRPTRGSVHLDGRDVTGRKPHQIARMGIARSFQMMNLFNDFTARENVTMALPELRAHGFDMRHEAQSNIGLRAAADAVLARVGLADKADIPAKALPYGDRRALEIGVALGAAPRVLCLDEPTAGLGSDAKARIATLIRELKGTLAVVLIEHDMEFLFALADRISVVHWGQILAHGTPLQLKANPWVRASKLGAPA